MDSFTPKVVLHGVLVEVERVGVLILGESGAGKSECALGLVSGGHCLIADDVVEVERSGGTLIGRSPERFAGLLEIRGLGILNVRRLFGHLAFKARHDIALCVEFHGSDAGERIGTKTMVFECLDVRLPKFVLPADGRRNMPLLVETAVRLFRLGGTTAESGLIEAHDDLVAPLVKSTTK